MSKRDRKQEVAGRGRKRGRASDDRLSQQLESVYICKEEPTNLGVFGKVVLFQIH